MKNLPNLSHLSGVARQNMAKPTKFPIKQFSSFNSKLTMEQVVICVKQEYDKLNRSVSLEQFGAYAKLVEGINQ